MYKVIRRIQREHDVEEDGHVTHVQSIYAPGRLVELTDWPSELVGQLLESGLIEPVQETKRGKGKDVPGKSRD
jgi:hypothetical protein